MAVTVYVVCSSNIKILDFLLQVSRQKTNVEDDMLRCKDEIVRLKDLNNKLSREKEELVKENANLIVQLTAYERENRARLEEMAGIR